VDAVHVTGMSWCTPLDEHLDGGLDAWHRLTAGDIGLRPAPAPASARNDLAGHVTLVALDAPPAQRQRTLAAAGLLAAFADAGVAPGDPDAVVVLGTSFGGSLDAGADDDGPDGTGSLARWAADVTAGIGHPNRPVTLTTACSAGSDAIALGAQLVRSGRYRYAVCGGVDVVSPAKQLGHSVLGTMTTDTLRAFDERHSGMLLGEGSAFLALEMPASAARRGARVHAALRGAGSANDAAGLTAPDPTGRSIVLAVRRALAGSGLTTADVGVLSAHGTATPVNDAVEAASLAHVFAGVRPGPVVFATKGALGHSLGACGAIEAVSVILALRDKVVPPVAGLHAPVADFPLPLARTRTGVAGATAGLSLTLGFGGFNTALLFATETAAEEPL
jgi:3-oxoacyl-[acyl-carrier-protein] synthase II